VSAVLSGLRLFSLPDAQRDDVEVTGECRILSLQFHRRRRNCQTRWTQNPSLRQVALSSLPSFCRFDNASGPLHRIALESLLKCGARMV